MAAPDEIAAALKPLGLAYPDRKLTKATLAAYVDHLSDIPAHLLAAAVKDHIQTSPWFPKISELRATAASIANTRCFETLPPAPIDPIPPIIPPDLWPLLQQAQSLEDAFYRDRTLDPAAWHALAAQFTSANRPHRAAHTLEKLRRIGMNTANK